MILWHTYGWIIIYVCVCISICIYVCIYIYIFIYLIHIYLYLYIYISTCFYISLHVYNIYIYMFIYASVCAYIYLYIYIIIYDIICIWYVYDMYMIWYVYIWHVCIYIYIINTPRCRDYLLEAIVATWHRFLQAQALIAGLLQCCHQALRQQRQDIAALTWRNHWELSETDNDTYW